MLKTCKACGLDKPLSEFHKDRSKQDGLNFYCKPCHISRQKVYEKRPQRSSARDGMKRCSRCKESKPTSEFHKSSRYYDGLFKVCKDCSYERHNDWRLRNLDKMSKDQKRRREADPDRWKDYSRKQNYGLQPGEYDKMLKDQNGSCAICHTTEAGGKGSFHVDHCHDTGEVRGLLCHYCNLGIGQFKHSTKLLSQAISYLKGFSRR